MKNQNNCQALIINILLFIKNIPMKNKIDSQGKCLYCDKLFKKAGITKHLNQHLEIMEAENKVKAKTFHLRIEGMSYFFKEGKSMFLNVLVDGNAPLQDLDMFLRNIWLECCGHMSTFQVKGKYYDDNWDDDFAEIGEKKKTKMSKIFGEGLVLDYEYDMGSTTPLTIKIIKELNLAIPESVRLLSRNEPLAILCDICHINPAVMVCSIHMGQPEEAFFCQSCKSKHAKKCSDFKDYSAMPVVNSPRMGTCAYTGGYIDKKRDSPYKG